LEKVIFGVQLTFINNIPMRALPLIPPHNLLNMIRHHLHQRLVVVDLVDPLRQLGVPDERVAAHLLAVLGGEVGDLVGAAPVELAAVGLRGVPFH